MKIYIIIVDSSDFVQVVQDKIQSLGKYYKISEKCFILSSDRDRAQNVYDELSGGTKIGLVVFEIKTETAINYWGYSNKELWKWLNDNKIE